MPNPIEALKWSVRQTHVKTDSYIRILGAFPLNKDSLIIRFETRYLQSLEAQLRPLPSVFVDDEQTEWSLMCLNTARETHKDQEHLIFTYSLQIPRYTHDVDIRLQSISDYATVLALKLDSMAIRSLLHTFEQATLDAAHDNRYPKIKCTSKHVASRNDEYLEGARIVVIIAAATANQNDLLDTIESLTRQTYDNWRIKIAVSHEAYKTAQSITTFLDDERISFISTPDGTLSSAMSIAVRQTIAIGYTLFLNQGDLLLPHALVRFVTFLTKTNTDFAYCDVDQIADPTSIPTQPRFLPNFNRDYLYSHNYITTGFMMSCKLLANMGSFSVTLDNAWNYELVLRASELSKKLLHIPEVLCHEGARTRLFRRENKRAIAAQERSVLERHFHKRRLAACVANTHYEGIYCSTFLPPAETPCVSIIIPNKDHIDYLRPCINSIREKAGYPNYEIVVVENNSTEEETFTYYREITQADERIRIYPYVGTFNYSKIINYGVRNTVGTLLLLLNNDTRVITDNFLAILAGYFTRAEVGVVGPQLLFPDGLVQHAGLALLESGKMGFMNQNLSPMLNRGYLDSLVCASACSAVLGACQMVRRSTFRSVGGYCEDLAITCNDIDFCWKVRKQGLDVVYTPHVSLFHKEFGSRNNDNANSELEAQSIREYQLLAQRWPNRYKHGDGFINPNLDPESIYYKLRA